jgi:hypothetical protein
MVYLNTLNNRIAISDARSSLCFLLPVMSVALFPLFAHSEEQFVSVNGKA